jgi:hypothetical protein
MTTLSHQTKKGDRALRLPLSEPDYELFVSDKTFARDQLDQLYWQYPELFPELFDLGYEFYGFTAWSKKLDLRCRRLRLVANATVYTVAPGFVMPYMTGYTDEVSKALFLMRFHVPCRAIAHVFGHDAMYWYRLEQSLGRFSVVGTTVKDAVRLPKDLVADEKHSWLGGERFVCPQPYG